MYGGGGGASCIKCFSPLRAPPVTLCMRPLPPSAPARFEEQIKSSELYILVQQQLGVTTYCVITCDDSTPSY